MQLDLSHYAPAHRAELEKLLSSAPWHEALDGGLLDRLRAARLSPPTTRNFIDTVVGQLVEFNEPKVRSRIATGCRDEEALLDAFSTWPEGLGERRPRISFLGLNVTDECNSRPRCLYCNQPHVASSVDPATWKRIIEEAAGSSEAGPYVYITGGEPLLLGENLWGPEGLVRFATQHGAGVNVNTNAALLSPAVALHLVSAGLLRLHVSLDSPDAVTHRRLRGGPLEKVLEGIYNVQLARELLGATWPGVHVNCVLTKASLEGFPQLFAFLLKIRRRTADRKDPFGNDLLPHLIPVGGEGNAPIRPSAEEFRRFYEDLWPRVVKMWDDYQDGLGAAKDRRPLLGYFSSPFHRVSHAGGLDAYVRASAAGRYGRQALAGHCYVAPTQAAYTPDGNQYRCGSHAVRRLLPVGNVHHNTLAEGVRAGLPGLASLPQEETCYGCALATLYINQSVEKRLREKLDVLLGRKKKTP